MIPEAVVKVSEDGAIQPLADEDESGALTPDGVMLGAHKFLDGEDRVLVHLSHICRQGSLLSSPRACRALRCLWLAVIGLLLVALTIVANSTIPPHSAVGGAVPRGGVPRPYCNALRGITPSGAAGGGGAAGTQGIRRQLGPGSTQKLPDGHCDAVAASSLGLCPGALPAAPIREDTFVNSGSRVELLKERTRESAWWHRWGATVPAAVATLNASLTRDEKLGLVRGLGWQGWAMRPGFYVGDTLSIP